MDKKKLNLLFITRKFPPTQGGMETMAFELQNVLKTKTNLKLLKWGGSKLALVVVLPYFFIYSSFYAIFKNPDIIYLQDGVLSPLGKWLKMISRDSKICITLHGLDVTFDNFLYKKVNIPSLKSLDQIITVSHATRDQVLKLGVEGSKIKVIPNGIGDDIYSNENKTELKKKVSKEIDSDLDGKTLILSHGRLVERKGVAWFIEHVFSELSKKHEDIVYVISGDGPNRQAVDAAVDKLNLRDKVKVLGRTSNDLRDNLYNAADIFMMPNIKIAGDMEGFGITQLEAATCECVVVASSLEGIKDAIIDGENGWLIEPGDNAAYISKLSEILTDKNSIETDGKKARKYTLENFSWDKIGTIYTETFAKVASK